MQREWSEQQAVGDKQKTVVLQTAVGVFYETAKVEPVIAVYDREIDCWEERIGRATRTFKCSRRNNVAVNEWAL